MAMKGKAPKTTNEKLHPLINAKLIPLTVMENASIIVPVFSPRAFWIAKHSLLIREDSSAVLLVSNHVQSYRRIASRYFILVFIVILSLATRRKSKYKKDKT